MTLRTLTSAAALCLIAAASTAAQQAEQSQADEEGWVQLFNGENLEGWEASEHPENWKVENGAIVAAGPRSHLFYVEQEYKNFEFKAEVMTTPGSNSGIYFHTQNLGAEWPSVGHEVQVNVTHSDPVKTGSLYNVVKVYKTPAKDNEWWEQHITVRGDNLVVRINGEIVVDYTQPPGVEIPRKIDRGYFALQSHDPDSVTYYRNIRARELPERRRRR